MRVRPPSKSDCRKPERSDAKPLDGGLFSVKATRWCAFLGINGTGATALKLWPVAYGSAGLWGVVADAAS